MTLRLLKIFRQVCLCGNMTEAANQLFMTQPAVSAAIKQLEQHLQTPLFDRSQRRILLNEAGRLLLQKANGILELMEELETSPSTLHQQAILYLGSSITIANLYLSRFYQAFHHQCPQTPLQVTVDSAANILQQLRDQQLDIGLVEGTIHSQEFNTIPLSSYSLVVIAPYLHPLGQKEKITLEEILDQPWLCREKGSAIRECWESFLTLHQHSCQPTWSSVNSQVLLQGVKEGVGLSILPYQMVAKQVEQHTVRILPVEGFPLENQNQLVWLKGKTLNPTQLQLTQIIVEESNLANKK